MANAKKAVPEGFSTVTPTLTVDDANAAIAWYGKALGAEEITRSLGPDGKVMHAEIRIGDSMIMLADAQPGHPARPTMICLYVEDADATYQRALAAGATVVREIADQFYGDRSGTLVDPFGHKWTLATHVEDVTPEEMKRRMASMGKPGSGS